VSRRTGDDYSVTECLDLYVRRGEELLATRAVRQGQFKVEMSLKFAAPGSLTTTSREPDEEDFRSFLITFRQFVSNDEPIFVNKIHNLVFLELGSEELRKRMAEARSQWSTASRVGAFQLVENGRQVAPEEVMDLWINGQYFHNDKRKEQAIARLDPLNRLFSRHLFLNHVITATNYVLFLGQVIVVGRRQGLLHA
jgi:hypothetical protein